MKPLQSVRREEINYTIPWNEVLLLRNPTMDSPLIEAVMDEVPILYLTAVHCLLKREYDIRRCAVYGITHPTTEWVMFDMYGRQLQSDRHHLRFEYNLSEDEFNDDFRYLKMVYADHDDVVLQKRWRSAREQWTRFAIKSNITIDNRRRAISIGRDMEIIARKYILANKGISFHAPTQVNVVSGGSFHIPYFFGSTFDFIGRPLNCMVKIIVPHIDDFMKKFRIPESEYQFCYDNIMELMSKESQIRHSAINMVTSLKICDMECPYEAWGLTLNDYVSDMYYLSQIYAEDDPSTLRTAWNYSRYLWTLYAETEKGHMNTWSWLIGMGRKMEVRARKLLIKYDLIG